MTFFDSVVTGLATGLGSAIGTYLATKHVVRRMEAIENKMLRKLNKPAIQKHRR